MSDDERLDNGVERAGIEGVVFAPRITGAGEAAAIETLPIPAKTVIEVAILSSLDDTCPNCGGSLVASRYGTCRKCGARTDLDVKTGQIGQRDQGDEREE